MNYFANFLLPLVIPAVFLLAGYWLAAHASRLSAAERLALAVLAGLGLTLWNVSAVNLVQPLSGIWAWLCLWPVLLTLLRRAARTNLVRDLREISAPRPAQFATLCAVALIVFILWPLLTRPSLVYYDGTSNHDAFFWIVAAEHLQEHTYLQPPVVSAEHPLHDSTSALIGLRPIWGRMGAEGFLSLTSSLVGLETIKIYVSATVALLVPWIAAVFLVARTFLVSRISAAALVALVALQPVFVFFHGNANLPNLLGALMSAAVVVATERSLRDATHRGIWLALLALSLHGVACSYPELLPFVIMPGGLLWLRAWFTHGVRAAWRPASLTALAWIAGTVINPASTLRAWQGFVVSFNTARANENWANLFAPLSPSEYIPALATLGVDASRALGPVAGVILAIVLCTGLFLAIRRATDRLGALCILSGAAALLLYTLATGFNYGWQKTVQFGGPFWAAFFPVAIVDAVTRARPTARHLRIFKFAMLAALGGFFLHATAFNGTDGHKWSRRKSITDDWFALRDYTHANLPSAPLLVEAASFRMAFFHGMWAAYFLADHPIFFGARGNESGGYLRGAVLVEGARATPVPAARLVGRAWADTFDANSERLFTGETLALLRDSNRVISSQGLFPTNGIPDAAGDQVVIELHPHQASRFLLELKPFSRETPPATQWRVTCRTDHAETFSTEIGGPPPWRFEVPLAASVVQRIELTATPRSPAGRAFPFAVTRLAIESSR